MAVVFGSIGSDCNMGATASATVNPSGSDRFLLGCIYLNADDTVSAVSFGGQTPTLIQRFNIGFGSSNTLWMYGLANPATGSAAFSATFTGGGSILWACAAVVYTGVHQTVSLGTPATGENTGTTPVTVDATSASGELVVDVFMAGCSAATVGASQTQRLNSDFSGNLGFRKFGVSEEAGAATTTMSWALTDVSGRWGTIAVALKPAGAAAGITRPQSGIGSGGMADMNGGMQGRAHRARNRIQVPANFHALGNRRGVPHALRF